ncbi:MAG: hypothetical protein ACI9SQ_001477, partial [Rubritalea sp.]
KNSHLTGGNVTTTPLNFSEFWIPMYQWSNYGIHLKLHQPASP